MYTDDVWNRKSNRCTVTGIDFYCVTKFIYCFNQHDKIQMQIDNTKWSQ